MTSSDSLQRFLFEHAAIRGELVHLDATWRAALERHDYPPAVRGLLGELMRPRRCCRPHSNSTAH